MSDWTTADEFYQEFVPTGNVTPASGLSYVHNEIDACATVYRKCIKIYTDRRKDINNDAQIPALYEECYVIELDRS
jgi:hypothetical protein